MSAKVINRKRVVRQQKIVITIIASFVICILILTLSLFHNTAMASASPIDKSYYTIQVESGDTLWDIANQYKDTYTNTMDYIEELKFINGLSSDQINAGSHLTIVSYN